MSTATKPYQEVSDRWEQRDGKGRLRTYVMLRCTCGTEWRARADNLPRMLSRECWHKGLQDQEAVA